MKNETLRPERTSDIYAIANSRKSSVKRFQPTRLNINLHKPTAPRKNEAGHEVVTGERAVARVRTPFTLHKLDSLPNGELRWSVGKYGPRAYLTCDKATAELICKGMNLVELMA